MALSAAEVDSLIVDLNHQYEQLSREYSEMALYERKIELSDLMASIEYQRQFWKSSGASCQTCSAKKQWPSESLN
jgi:hypothetical protein